MIPAGVSLVLASRSPQRRAILERLGVAFEVRPADVDEREQGDPVEVASANALAKARAAMRGGEPEAVLGVDTVVALDGRLYDKPADEAQARLTLRALSGNRHDVVSGLALLWPGGEHVASATTAVMFRTLDERTLDWYAATGEWSGRAGAYAIQGAGAALIARVEGDYENVVGLPLALLLELWPALIGGQG